MTLIDLCMTLSYAFVMSKKQKLPGTIWLNRGCYNWKVKLPETDKRKNYRLIPPRGKMALPESKGISLAESIAWRMWKKASKTHKPQSKSTANKDRTLEEVACLFTSWAETYYRRSDGSFTREHYAVELYPAFA